MRGMAPFIASKRSETVVVLGSKISSTCLSLVSFLHCDSTVVGFAVVWVVASRSLVLSFAEGFGTYWVRFSDCYSVLLSLLEIDFRGNTSLTWLYFVYFRSRDQMSRNGSKMHARDARDRLSR